MDGNENEADTISIKKKVTKSPCWVIFFGLGFSGSFDQSKGSVMNTSRRKNEYVYLVRACAGCPGRSDCQVLGRLQDGTIKRIDEDQCVPASQSEFVYNVNNFGDVATAR